MNEQQVEKASHIASLIVRNMQDNLTNEERHELQTWLQEGSNNFLLFEELMDEDKLGEALDELHAIDHHIAFEKLSQKIFEQQIPVKRHTSGIWWYMVAAVLLLIAGGITYLSINKKEKAPAIVVSAKKKDPAIQPDSKKALLILADGSTIVLNEMNNGVIAQQGNISVKKNRNGRLEYKLSGKPPATTLYNTIQTPRGGEYQLVLDDGTSIWLNSASTLRFPIHFNNQERHVALSGEGYFEVSHATDHKKTFIVDAGNMEVQAMGTSFNISAYKEDHTTQTTVVEGTVKVKRDHKDHLLSPGKKLITHHDSTVTIEDADIKQETAWKNGEFVFRNTPLQIVMNELTRWYDMDVVYKQPVPSLHFSGEIPRESDIVNVLQMLEYTGGVQFSISNRTITVF
jgi:transmembrane sensor